MRTSPPRARFVGAISISRKSNGSRDAPKLPCAAV